MNLSKFRLVSTSRVINLARALMVGNDIDFDQAVENIRLKVEKLTTLANTAESAYNDAVAKAEQARDAAANAAAEAFKQATGSKADTASLRRAASALLAATNWFEKWDVTGLTKKFLNEVLTFAGINNDVLAKMRQAASEKRAEADRLDAAAADALQKATKAQEDATERIADEFARALNAAEPKLTEAGQLRQLASELLDAYKTFSRAK